LATVDVATEQSRAYSPARDLTTLCEPAIACGGGILTHSAEGGRGPTAFGSGLPFLTSADRLYAHHALRC
jgi:hypothetical protein